MKLNLQKREVTWKQVKVLRRNNQIPWVIYSKHLNETIPVQFDKMEFLKLYKLAWETTPINIVWDWINELAMIYWIQKNPTTDYLLHVDFLAVKKDQLVQADVPVVLIWESLLEKQNEWKIELLKSTVRVEALPQNLPHNIQIERSSIKTLNDVIFVKDIELWKDVKVIDSLELAVVTVVQIEDSSDDAEEATEKAAE